jgi:hypothetical protein
MRARGGTRTGRQPLKTRHSPENIPNPDQSDAGTTETEAQGVHIVHALFLPTLHPVQGMSRRFSDAGRFGRLPLRDMAQPEFDTRSWPSMSARTKPGVGIPCDDERCT